PRCVISHTTIMRLSPPVKMDLTRARLAPATRLAITQSAELAGELNQFLEGCDAMHVPSLFVACPADFGAGTGAGLPSVGQVQHQGASASGLRQRHGGDLPAGVAPFIGGKHRRDAVV